ncbi:MAG: FadR family transcriptional regulator [Acetobacteraceae bacterium]|nr:FadR family transcriptional regulator [Acetobacteraceae bacterium]
MTSYNSSRQKAEVADEKTPAPNSVPPSRNLTQKVVAHLSSLIETGALASGEKLPPESELVRQQGVSRTVVREAISQLQAAGLVTKRQGIGTFVLDGLTHQNFGIRTDVVRTRRDVLEMLELRMSLETEAAALAAARRTDEHLAEMRRALDTFRERLGNGGETVTPDFQFHLGIARATGNHYFPGILSHLGLSMIPRSRLPTNERQPHDVDYLVRISNEHEDTYNAIVRRDSEAARAALRNHLGNSRERMRRALNIQESI